MINFKVSILAVAAAALVCGGCASNRGSASSPNPPSMTIDASSREILVGETVTLIARTRDTYGRDATVRWTTTAGSLKTEQDGRVARVKFDETGTYTVKAMLSIEGQEVEGRTVEVRVRPVG